MFLTRLILSDTALPDIWILERALVWSDEKYGRIEVPQGFFTDLASIPRFLRNLPDLDPNGLSRRPAAVHDFLYATQTLAKGVADEFLQDALRAEGVGAAVARTFYYAVHWFGGPSWRSDAAKLHPPSTAL